MPTRIEKFTVNRSPHVDKKSMDQFEVRTHKRLIDILEPTPLLWMSWKTQSACGRLRSMSNASRYCFKLRSIQASKPQYLKFRKMPHSITQKRTGFLSILIWVTDRTKNHNCIAYTTPLFGGGRWSKRSRLVPQWRVGRGLGTTSAEAEPSISDILKCWLVDQPGLTGVLSLRCVMWDSTLKTIEWTIWGSFASSGSVHEINPFSLADIVWTPEVVLRLS